MEVLVVRHVVYPLIVDLHLFHLSSTLIVGGLTSSASISPRIPFITSAFSHYLDPLSRIAGSGISRLMEISPLHQLSDIRSVVTWRSEMWRPPL
ncbi:hypothetical protein LINGRAHAP2_LOCUS9292 [Linum grandiflorum]